MVGKLFDLVEKIDLFSLCLFHCIWN